MTRTLSNSDSNATHPHPGPLPDGEGGPGWQVAPVYVVFFLSGAAALTYEISWSRQIGLLFGNTASAAATVLASYFIGLAVGYALAGRFADYAKRPLLAYGVMELCAAAWALVVPLLIASLRKGELAEHLHAMTPQWRFASRAMLCILLFLPGTTTLGATLPLMARWVGEGRRGSSNRVACAYGLNTFGGLVGVLLATIVLLSQVGVVGSSYLAAALSAVCGFAAIACSILAVGRISNPSPNTSKFNFDPVTNWAPTFRLFLLVALSGFITLALEVLYTRLFALTFHNSTYTFGLIIAIVLLGLAGGAWLAAWMQRWGDALQRAGWMFLLAGAAISCSTLLFLNQTGLSYFRGGDTFANYMTASVGLVAVVVLPPALLLGTVLPLLWDAACGCIVGSEGDRRSLAKVVGRLTAVNTLCAALGALVASFVLLPYFGLWGSFMMLAICCVVGSLLLLATRRSIACWATMIATGCLILAVWRVTTQQTAVPDSKVLISRAEGAYGWIDVLKDKRSGSLSLRENVNYTHGSTASAAWERRQSHIPLLVHPKPKRVLYLGSGTGATAGGAVMHDEVESIVIAELIPEVIDAARQFEKSNLGVFEDPRTEVHIDDARHFLLATDRQFDVIIADLFVPWESKTGYLYTVDHYEITRQRLAPGGLFCHWLPMWQLGQEEFEMIVDSFASVFPHTTLWWGKVEYDRSIIGLVGSNEPLSFHADAIEARLERMRKSWPEDPRLNRPVELVRRYIGDWQTSGQPLLNTDEHPRLEFAMPLTYANRRTVKLHRMQTYYEETLSTLLMEDVACHGFDPEEVAPGALRQWQQLQLRK